MRGVRGQRRGEGKLQWRAGEEFCADNRGKKRGAKFRRNEDLQRNPGKGKRCSRRHRQPSVYPFQSNREEEVEDWAPAWGGGSRDQGGGSC